MWSLDIREGRHRNLWVSAQILEKQSGVLELFQVTWGYFKEGQVVLWRSVAPKRQCGKWKVGRPGVVLSAASGVAWVNRLTSLGLAFSSVKSEVGLSPSRSYRCHQCYSWMAAQGAHNNDKKISRKSRMIFVMHSWRPPTNLWNILERFFFF